MSLPFERAGLAPPAHPVLLIGAEADPSLSFFEDLTCVQTMRPHFDALKAVGHRVQIAAEGDYGTGLMLTDRHRDVSRLRFAQLWMHTQPGGQIIVSGAKTSGVDAFAKEVKGFAEIEGSLPKAHGKVFWLSRGASVPEAVSRWLRLAEFTVIEGGYQTVAGAFSSDAADPGSQALVAHFPLADPGRVADLGAGWGYLSAELLARTGGVSSLHLFEANHSALEAAKVNLRAARNTGFHWSDVVGLSGFDTSFDLVISNPPFHQGREAAPGLGQAFLETAARILAPRGRALIVANRQLPYEGKLQQLFSNVEKLSETGGYKIYSASRPRKRRG